MTSDWVTLLNKKRHLASYTTLQYHCIFLSDGCWAFPPPPLDRMEGPLLVIMKAFSTNNSNYTSSLLKCDKPDNISFYWIRSPDRHFILSLSHLSIPLAWVNVRELTAALTVSFLTLWFTNVVFVFTSACPCTSLRYLWLYFCLVVLQTHTHTHTSCGICSPGCINLVPSFTHFLSGWQVDM